MNENEAQYLDLFAGWLDELGEDAARLTAVLEAEGAAQPVREAVVAGLNYLFKSLDLIPDGVDDVGYLDDAFVLRVAARSLGPVEGFDVLTRLASEAEQVQAFLGPNYARLERYVAGLRTGAARGRTVAEIVGSGSTMAEFVSEVRDFASDYQAPAFTKEGKTLIKLGAFFDAKLPR